ncbi:hypothetical protein [Thalassospira xiamenensis]|uniref:Uncharacterized protein n=1 Tax=Thalassospira xiamenensis TaxID=220697 RepID=A0A367XGA8_9PROT|nr:hypothetical protein [Thalassospira xiamenensis]KZB57337.1 hypothetical protein AUP41_10980 [Thalassospira xiamenensis]RCK52676.1 hypothetical protein TH44_00110 [Thalassospira xiamenensis]
MPGGLIRAFVDLPVPPFDAALAKLFGRIVSGPTWPIRLPRSAPHHTALARLVGLGGRDAGWAIGKSPARRLHGLAA